MISRFCPSGTALRWTTIAPSWTRIDATQSVACHPIGQLGYVARNEKQHIHCKNKTTRRRQGMRRAPVGAHRCNEMRNRPQRGQHRYVARPEERHTTRQATPLAMKQHTHAWRARETPKGSVYGCESYVCAHYSNSIRIRLATWQIGSHAILYRSHINFVCESYLCAHFCNRYIHKAYFTIV